MNKENLIDFLFTYGWGIVGLIGLIGLSLFFIFCGVW